MTPLFPPSVPNVPDGFEFSIRTPVTPPRWRDFDEELSWCWGRVVEGMVALEGYRGKGGMLEGAPR